jgi:hypothetical protein
MNVTKKFAPAAGSVDALKVLNVSRSEKVFDYFEAGGYRFVEFLGYIAASLGHVGLSAAFSADDRSYLSNDIAGFDAAGQVV